MDERIVQLLEEQNSLLEELNKEIKLLVNLTSIVAGTTQFSHGVGKEKRGYVKSIQERIMKE